MGSTRKEASLVEQTQRTLVKVSGTMCTCDCVGRPRKTTPCLLDAACHPPSVAVTSTYIIAKTAIVAWEPAHCYTFSRPVYTYSSNTLLSHHDSRQPFLGLLQPTTGTTTPNRATAPSGRHQLLCTHSQARRAMIHSRKAQVCHPRPRQRINASSVPFTSNNCPLYSIQRPEIDTCSCATNTHSRCAAAPGRRNGGSPPADSSLGRCRSAAAAAPSPPLPPTRQSVKESIPSLVGG